MVTSIGGADEGKASDFPTRGGDGSGRRGDRGRSAKSARPEIASSDRVGGERVEEQLVEGQREGGGALPSATVVVARGGGGETLTAAAGVERRGRLRDERAGGRPSRVFCFALAVARVRGAHYC